MSAKNEEVESALKDVKRVSKGKKVKRAKSCVSNCMKKGIVSSDKRWNFVFWKSKKNKKKNPKMFLIFFRVDIIYHDCLYEMNGLSREGERRRIETMVYLHQ